MSNIWEVIVQSVKWDGKDDNKNPLPSGIYFVRLKVGKFSEIKKLVFLR